MKLQKISRQLSYILRHNPGKLKMDRAGWIGVKDLLAELDLSLAELEIIVKTNDKSRFVLSPDKTKIKAAQGHSIDVKLELQEETPPEILYHGTADKWIDSILKAGLIRGSRHHVHLTSKPETALEVGKRWGKPVLLKIAAGLMTKEGYKFYVSENGVWLTDHVPAEYIKVE